ncbi:hypothetical protein QAD02_016197 [Eretmocerus hayati]|uniref:Uncharacterized protein n=1 Tax=Eretmocerus hayati TaxID=131215 RepID=A0ACC2P9X6_9HYME|nr:hypothetical protein QAD02_016197 [Eretmocerus hayati]
MDSKKYINFTTVFNTVNDRLEDDSLIHTFSLKTKTLKSTKLVNARLLKYAKSKKTYDQFVQWKKKALEEAAENVEVTDGSDSSDDDFKESHSETNNASAQTKTCKSNPFTTVPNPFTAVTKKSVKKKVPDKTASWISFSNESKEKGVEDLDTQNNENIADLALQNQVGCVAKWEYPFGQGFIHKELDGSVDSTSVVHNVISNKKNKNKKAVNNSSRDYLPCESTASKTSSEKHASNEDKKRLKDVEKDLTSNLDEVDAEVSSSSEDDVKSDFIPSDFKAQSTQIFSDTLIPGSVEKKKKLSRLSHKGVLKQPKDSVNENSKVVSSSLENEISPVDEIQIENSSQDKKSVELVTKTNANGTLPPPSQCKGSIVDAASKPLEKSSLKIIGEERLTRKYKIVSNKKSEVQSKAPNKIITRSRSTDGNKNSCLINDEEFGLNNLEAKSKSESFECNSSDADSENEIACPPTKKPSATGNKAMKSKMCKPEYVSRQMKKLKEMRLIEEDTDNSDHMNNECNGNGISKQVLPSMLKKLSPCKKLNLQESSSDSSSDEEKSLHITKSTDFVTKSARLEETSGISNTYESRNNNPSSQNTSNSSDSNNVNNLSENNQNCQIRENRRRSSLSTTSEDESDTPSNGRNKITSDVDVAKLENYNNGELGDSEEWKNQETYDSHPKTKRPCKKVSTESQEKNEEKSSPTPCVSLLTEKNTSRIDSTLQAKQKTCELLKNLIPCTVKIQSQDMPSSQGELDKDQPCTTNHKDSLSAQNHQNGDDDGSQDHEEDEDMSSSAMKKLSQFKKIDLYGNNSDSSSDDGEPLIENKVTTNNLTQTNVKEWNGEPQSPQNDAPDADNESIQSSPLEYVSPGEGSCSDDDVGDTSPDKIEGPDFTEEKNGHSVAESEDGEDQYKDAEEENEMSFKSFSSGDDEKRVHQSNGLIDQKSSPDDVEIETEIDVKDEKYKDTGVTKSDEAVEFEGNRSSDRGHNKNLEALYSSHEARPKFLDNSDRSQALNGGDDNLCDKLDEPVEVDDDEMKPSAVEKISHLKKMDLFSSISDSDDEKPGKKERYDLTAEELRNGTEEKKYTKGSKVLHHSNEIESSEIIHGNQKDNNFVSLKKNKDCDMEFSEKKEIPANCLVIQDGLEEDLDVENHQNVKKKRSKKLKKEVVHDEVEPVLKEDMKTKSDEQQVCPSDRKKKRKRLMESNVTPEEKGLCESSLKDETKVIDGAQDIVTLPRKQIESQELFSSEEEELPARHELTDRVELTNRGTQNSRNIMDEPENDDHDEPILSPSALKRLSQIKKMNLYDDSSDSSSDEENSKSKNTIHLNNVVKETTPEEELNLRATEKIKDRGTKSKSPLASKSLASRASVEKSSNGNWYVTSDSDEGFTSGDKSGSQKSPESNVVEGYDYILQSPTNKSKVAKKKKSNILPTYNDSKIENLEVPHTNDGDIVSSPRKSGTPIQEFKSKGLKNSEARPSTSCKKGKLIVEDLEKSTDSCIRNDLEHIVIAETQESTCSIMEESEVVYPSQAEKPTARVIGQDGSLGGNCRNNIPDSAAERISESKISRIFDLVKKENLTPVQDDPSSELDDLSESEETYVLEVPKNVFNFNLKGKRFAFHKAVLTIGNRKYEAFQRRTAPTLSCVLKSVGKNEFKAENIRPVITIVTRRKKEPIETMDSEDYEFQNEKQLYVNHKDKSKENIPNSNIRKDSKSAKRKLSLTSPNLSKSQNFGEFHCEEPSPKRRKSKDSPMSSVDSETHRKNSKTIHPESEVTRKRKKEKKVKIVDPENENLLDSSYSKIQSGGEPQHDTTEKKIREKNRLNFGRVQTEKVSSSQSLTSDEEKEDRKFKISKGIEVEEHRDVHGGFSHVTVRKRRKLQDLNSSGSENVESSLVTTEYEMKRMKPKISTIDRETNDEMKRKSTEASFCLEDDHSVAKKNKKIQICDNEWEFAENEKASKKSKLGRKSPKPPKTVNNFENESENAEVFDKHLDSEGAMKPSSGKSKISLSSGIGEDGDEDIIPCSIQDKRVAKSDRKIMKVKSLQIEEPVTKTKQVPKSVVPPFIENKSKLEKKPVESESKTLSKKQKNVDQKAVKKSEVVQKEPKLTKQSSKSKTLEKKENFSLLGATQGIRAIIDRVKFNQENDDTSGSSSRDSRYGPLDILRAKKYKTTSSSDEDDKKYVKTSFRVRDKLKKESDEDSPKPSTSLDEFSINNEEVKEKKKKKKHKKEGPIYFDE